MKAKKKPGRVKKSLSKADDTSTKERMIVCATKIFAQKGFEGARVQDILDAADVNISAISYYFGNKEGLYLECLKKAASIGIESSARVLIPPSTPEEFKVRIEIFSEELIMFGVQHTDKVALLRMESKNPNSFTKNIFLPSIRGSILKFFESAQKNKVIVKNIDPKVVATIYFTSLVSLGNEPNIINEFTGKDISDPVLRNSINKHIIFLLGNILQ